MLEQFAEKTRMILWRKLWLALAESEKELGLNPSDTADRKHRRTP